jgi:hypothetical protein
MTTQPLTLKNVKVGNTKTTKVGDVQRSTFDKVTREFGEPVSFRVRVRTTRKGHYAIEVKIDEAFVSVGSVDQQAVGIYSLNFVSGSSYRDRLTLNQAVEVVVHAYLQDLEYAAYQASEAGLAEQAERDARAATVQAQYEATQQAAQARKARLADLGIESNGMSLTIDQIDALLALVPVTVA